MHEHFATEDEARACVDPFVAAWCMDTGLRGLPDDFLLEFRRADVIDRNPTPNVVGVGTGRLPRLEGSAIGIHMSCNFPAPPTNFEVTPRVEVMYHQYKFLRETELFLLAAVGYFCLTVIENYGCPGRPGRRLPPS